MLSAMSWGPFYSNPQIFSKPLWLADNLCLCLSHLWILCLENYFPHYPSAAHLPVLSNQYFLWSICAPGRTFARILAKLEDPLAYSSIFHELALQVLVNRHRQRHGPGTVLLHAHCLVYHQEKKASVKCRSPERQTSSIHLGI